MSMTVNRPAGAPSVTQDAHKHPTLRLPSSPIQILLGNALKAVHTLPQANQEEVLQAIRDWETLFFSAYQLESTLGSVREDAAHALLFFRFNNIKYIMHNYAKGDYAKVIWLQIYNELKEIVASILPRDINLESFIEADEKKQRETQLRFKVDQALKEIRQNLNAIFAQQEQGLYESADRINQELQMEGQAIKRVLVDLNNERKEATETDHRDIDRITETVTQIYQETERQLMEAQKLGEKIHVQENTLMNLLDQCEAVVAKI